MNCQPEIKNFLNAEIPIPEKINLKNGIELFIINRGEQEVCEIDVILPAGRFEEDIPLSSELLNATLDQGTKDMSAEEISERLDFYGAKINSRVYNHNITVSLYSTNNCIDKSILILEQIIKAPIFSDKEIEILKNIICENLKRNQKIGSYVAMQKVLELYYGLGHPLGRERSIQAVKSITRDDLIKFHKNTFTHNGTKIFVSGKVTEKIIEQIALAFSDNWGNSNTPPQLQKHQRNSSFEEITIVNRDESIQSSISCIAEIPQITESEYINLSFLVIILGGYFGSRLMKNIREEKGYTYGINSSIEGNPENAYIEICTECDTKYTQNVIDEINIELKKLIKEPIEEDELKKLKSYILSKLVACGESPFGIATYYKSNLYNEYSDRHFFRTVESIKKLTADSILLMAKKYLDPHNFHIVIVGDENKLKKIKNQY